MAEKDLADLRAIIAQPPDWGPWVARLENTVDSIKEMLK